MVQLAFLYRAGSLLHSLPCGSPGTPRQGRASSLRVLAAKQKAQGTKKAAKSKQRQPSQEKTSERHKAPGGNGATAASSSTGHSARQFIQQSRSYEGADATEDTGTNENFESRLQELKQRSDARRISAPAEELEAAEMDSYSRPASPEQTSSSRDKDDKSQSFWSKTAVAVGAVALTGVFLFATVGLDLGLGGRRGSPPTPPQISLSGEEQKKLQEQAAKFEQQAKDGKGKAKTDALASAAGAYATLGDLGKSADVLQQLAASEPNDVSVWQTLTLQMVESDEQRMSLNKLCLQAEVQIRQGKGQEAVASYEKALANSPAPTVTLLQGLASALSQEGRHQEAVDRLLAVRKDAAKADSSVGLYEANMLLAKAYAAWPRHTADALAVYDELTKDNPNDFRAFLAKGLVLKSAGKMSDAQRSFLQARYLAPPEARNTVDNLAER